MNPLTNLESTYAPHNSHAARALGTKYAERLLKHGAQPGLDANGTSTTSPLSSSVHFQQSLTTVEESPLTNVFLFESKINPEALKKHLEPIAVEHERFFNNFSNAFKAGNKEQIIRNLRTLEDKEFSFENISKITRQKTNALSNAYRNLSMKEVIRFYDRLEEAGIETTSFMKTNYALALNREGKSKEAIAFAAKLLNPTIEGPTSSQAVQTQAELLTTIGTAYKNMFLKDLNNSDALETAYQAYSLAFEKSLSYYPGINVVRTLLYKGEIEKAKQFARLVYPTVLHADTQKSLWPALSLLELTLVIGNKSERQKLLPIAARLINDPQIDESDIKSFITHLEFLKDRNLIDASEINDVTSKLANPSLIETTNNKKAGWKYSSISEAIESTTYVIGKTRTGNFTPFNARFGGFVVDSVVKQSDQEIRTEVLKQIAGGNITDIELNEFIPKTQKYIEGMFRLRNKDGIRDIENMQGPRHIELEAFWKGLLDVVHYNKSKMAATSVMLMPLLGEGDCRHTNEASQYLINGKIRADREKIISSALKDLKNNNSDSFEEKMESLGKLRRKIVLMDTKISARIQNNGPYNIKRENGTQGRALLLDSKEEQHIDNHTLSFLVEYDKNGEISSMTLLPDANAKSGMKAIDAWYSGEDVFQLSNTTIQGNELEEFARTGKLIIKNGAHVVDSTNNQETTIPITLEPEVFSNARQNKARRYDPSDLVIGSFIVGTPDLEMYTPNSEKREQFYTNFVEPVMIHGLNLMANDHSKPEEQLRAKSYLEHLGMSV